LPNRTPKCTQLSRQAESLVAQAQRCASLVQAEQLEEAMLVLRSLTDQMIQNSSSQAEPSQSELGQAQQIKQVLMQALGDATEQRENSKRKLQHLRSVNQAKAVYSDSSLPL